MQPIVLTPLEALLIGGLISLVCGLVSGLAVKMAMAGNYVSRRECRAQREMIINLARSYSGLKRDTRQIYAMLRAVVSHMGNLDPEQRERILNMPAPTPEER